MNTNIKLQVTGNLAQKRAVDGASTSNTGGQVDVELNMLEGAIDDIINAKRALLNRLYNVTGIAADELEPVPQPMMPGVDGEPCAPKVPMADRVQYLRCRLEQVIRDFDVLLNRIEV
jgi:hypothetical protein